MNGLGLFGFRVLSFFFGGYSCKERSGVLGWPCLLMLWVEAFCVDFYFIFIFKKFCIINYVFLIFSFMIFYAFCICFSINATLYRFYRERKCEELGDWIIMEGKQVVHCFVSFVKN
jgi:hypothetical protein